MSYRTALIGFGKIAAGYADDSAMARHFRYATHAQVLTDHPAFDWRAVVDPAKQARNTAQQRWSVPEVVAETADLACRDDIEVAVLVSPPEARTAALDGLPNLRAVLMEKPIAGSLSDAKALIETYRSRGILVAVNLTRRAETTMRSLSGGGLSARIGRTQAAFGVYGKGLENNGVHLIDLVRMVIGEVNAVQAVAGDEAFCLRCAGDAMVMVQALDFNRYRELGLDIWGEKGHLALVHEGLTLIETPVGPHRYADGERELIRDTPAVSETELGRALYCMYDNLAAALDRDAVLFCSGDEALRSMAVIDALRRSAAEGGRMLDMTL